MNKEEYAKLNYLLAKIKYELVKILYNQNVSNKTRTTTERQIKMIEEISKICIIGDSNE